MSDDEVTELELLDPDATIRNQVWELKAKGYTKSRIAQMLNIHRHTVSKHMKDAAKEVLEEHMGTSAIEILTEELAKLADLESEISRDLAMIQRTKGMMYFQNADGEYEEVPAAVIDAQKARLFKQKADIIAQRLKMLQDCGAMPKTPEAMKKALKDYQVGSEGDEINLENINRSDDEIETNIMQLLKHGIRMTDDL